MVSLRESFLNRFDSAVRPEIIQYGKRITEASKGADVLMFMARKSVCLAECLESLRLATFHCPVISDRVLDTNLRWLAAKKVMIFDDALISGTSLYQTVERLKASGVRSDDIRIQVLCVNTKWHSEELVRPELPYLELSDPETASLCARIVEAISVVPRPYAVDFPLYKHIRIPIATLDLITSLDGWAADEVTTPIQAGQEVFTITFTPTGSVLSTLDRELGWHFSGRSLIKVRLYGRRLKHDRQHAWCCMFPIVAMEPLQLTTVAQLFESVAGHTGDKKSFLKSFTPHNPGSERLQLKASAKLRLISFLASARLAKIWLSHIFQFIPHSPEPLEDQRSYAYLFPPAVIDSIQSLAAGEAKLFEFAPLPADNNKVPRLTSPVEGRDVLPDQISIEKDLTRPFLRLYQAKELTARQLALKYGRRVFDLRAYRHTMDRLRTGFTLPEIRRSIEHMRGVVDVEQLASLFLDRAIDRGTVVPITCVKGGYVYRAYRHGEDIEFCEAEERLCVQMLAALSKTSGRTELPHVWVEKSLVLLIRIGLEQQFFNAWEHTLGDYKSMGIRYSLHGAVVATGSSKLYHTVNHYGLSDLMQQHRYIRRRTPTALWQISEPPTGGIHSDRMTKVQLVGALLGRVLAGKGEEGSALLSEQDLTLLATCLYPKDVAGALAAEVDAAARDWALAPVVGPDTSIASMTCVEADQAAVQVRRSTAFLAVNSGIWKVSSFRAGRPWAIIQTIAESLTDPIHRSAWESLFPRSGRQGQKSVPINLLELIDNETVWLWRFKAYLGLLESALRYQAVYGTPEPKTRKQTKDRRERRLQRVLADLELSASEASRGKTDGSTIVKAIRRLNTSARESTLNVDAVRDFIFKQLDACVSESKAILTEVDSIAATFGHPEMVCYYTQILHVEMRGGSLGEQSPWRRVVEIFHEIRAEARRIDPTTIVADLELNQCEIRQGMWMVASGTMSRVWLTRLALRVLGSQTGSHTAQCTLFANVNRSSALLKAGKSSSYNGPLFWENAAVILRQLPRADVSAYRVVVDKSEVSPRVVQQETLREGRNIRLSLEHELPVEAPCPTSHFLNAYCYGGDSVKKEQRVQSKATIGILSVVADEMKAISAFLANEERFAEREGSRYMRDFYEASLPGRDDSRHDVVVTRAIEQGNRSIMPAYQALMDEYHPQLIILIGIGGGIHKDARACDVVLADSVFYYDKRVETDTGTQHRMLGYRIEARLLRYVNRFFDAHGDVAELASAQHSFDEKFRVHMGPIGTGEAVVRFRDAEVRKWLHSVNDKALALETEAGGLAQQFAEDTLRTGEKASGYLVLRGISDHADQAKDDKWRVAAATNAMKALEVLLSFMPADWAKH